MTFARVTSIAALPLLLLAPQAAFADPVYLTCVYQENGAPERLDITANEQAGTVSLSVPRNGYSAVVRAAFSRDRVSFSEGPVLSYVINRTNLAFTVARLGGGSVEGKCQLQPPPKRAF